MGKIKLKITTINPVTIGSGAELSPYSDYIIDKGEVCFIDKKSMTEKIINKGEKYLEDYIYGVANGIDKSQTKSTFDLKAFLTGKNIIKDIDEVASTKCKLIGDVNSKLPIKGVIKSPLDEPYFPGSTIKGALKTVLMYNWLKTNKDASKTIERVIENGNFNWLEKNFEYKEDELTRNIIRRNTIQQVTDSSLISKEAKLVVDCYRKMPIRFECVAKGQISEFELVLDSYKWSDLAEQANQYALDVLEREFELIEEQKNVNNYYNHLVDLEEMINEADENTAYFRLGFGKGYYLNSLGIAIYDYVSQKGKENLYDKFEDFINKEFARKDRYGNIQEIELDEFPKTRLFVTNTQEPLGWVKIEACE